VYKFEVGKLYNPNRTVWPEVAQYNYRGGNHELVLFYNRPRKSEVKAISQDSAEFALYVSGQQIVFLYRFNVVDWSDAPFTIHRVPVEERTMPPEPVELERELLQVFLVDASNGILCVLRALTMSPEFTRILHAAIRAQAEMPFNQAAYDRELTIIQRRYSPSQLVELAAARFSSSSMRGG